MKLLVEVWIYYVVNIWTFFTTIFARWTASSLVLPVVITKPHLLVWSVIFSRTSPTPKKRSSLWTQDLFLNKSILLIEVILPGFGKK